MAVQIPDPGTGNGQTGDNEYVFRKKVKDNFSDQTHAASRLVGEATGNLPEFTSSGISRTGIGGSGQTIAGITNAEQMTESEVRSAFWKKLKLLGTGVFRPVLGSGRYPDYLDLYDAFIHVSGSTSQFTLAIQRGTGKVTAAHTVQQFNDYGFLTFYTTKNTTVDSNKNIKESSPVVRVFADHLDKIHEANDLPIKYTRNGVGDYTIDGTTGLRENDWQIVIPEDDHRNQLIAFTLEDDNGTIRLKTYKRTFNMTTFMFEPDLSIPLDIPEGRWVDLHFNDLPQEQLDEPIE